MAIFRYSWDKISAAGKTFGEMLLTGNIFDKAVISPLSFARDRLKDGHLGGKLRLLNKLEQ